MTLSGLRGGPTVLVFVPFAFSGTCTGELCELRDNIAEFEQAGVHVAVISCDPMHSLRAWAAQEGFGFDLLSDFWPHGEVARAYGVFDEAKGHAGPGQLPGRRRRHPALVRREPSRSRPRPRPTYRAAVAAWPPDAAPVGCAPVVCQGPVAQLVRAPRLHRGGRRFETGRAHPFDLSSTGARSTVERAQSKSHCMCPSPTTTGVVSFQRAAKADASCIGCEEHRQAPAPRPDVGVRIAERGLGGVVTADRHRRPRRTHRPRPRR